MMNMRAAPVKLVIAFFPLTLVERPTLVERFLPILSKNSVIADNLAPTSRRQRAKALGVVYIFA
jgi:hypothetical protein